MRPYALKRMLERMLAPMAAAAGAYFGGPVGMAVASLAFGGVAKYGIRPGLRVRNKPVSCRSHRVKVWRKKVRLTIFNRR